METKFLFIIFAILLLSAEQAKAGCFEDWSRCTPATSGGTGILWKPCPEYCQKCKGYSRGECVDFPQGGPCSGKKQCKCSGNQIPKSDNWLDKQTCSQGL